LRKATPALRSASRVIRYQLFATVATRHGGQASTRTNPAFGGSVNGRFASYSLFATANPSVGGSVIGRFASYRPFQLVSISVFQLFDFLCGSWEHWAQSICVLLGLCVFSGIGAHLNSDLFFVRIPAKVVDFAL
jgi:hypothetical protein